MKHVLHYLSAMILPALFILIAPVIIGIMVSVAAN